VDSAEERFWKKVSKDKSGCWLWVAALNSRGYGLFGFGGSGKTVLAHRWIFFRRAPGKPSKGQKRKMVLHSCGMKLCVNPKHLFLGTALDSAKNCQKLGLAPIGESNGHAKMTEKKVDEIRQLFATGEYRVQDLAKEYKFTVTGTREIVNGVTWKPGYEKYKEVLEAVRRKLYHQLMDEEKVEIKRLYAVGDCTQRALAAQFGVSANTVWMLVHGTKLKGGPI